MFSQGCRDRVVRFVICPKPETDEPSPCRNPISSLEQYPQEPWRRNGARRKRRAVWWKRSQCQFEPLLDLLGEEPPFRTCASVGGTIENQSFVRRRRASLPDFP